MHHDSVEVKLGLDFADLAAYNFLFPVVFKIGLFFLFRGEPTLKAGHHGDCFTASCHLFCDSNFDLLNGHCGRLRNYFYLLLYL